MSGLKPYQMTGTPDEGDGRRLVPPEELFEMLNSDPQMRRAVDSIEKEEGKPREVTMMAVKMLQNFRSVDMHVAEQKRAIDLQLAKKKGILYR